MQQPSVPPELRAIQPFLQRATELKGRDDVMAYYCNYYAAKLAIAAKPTSKDANAFLSALMDQLEADKTQLSDQNNKQLLTNDDLAYQHVEAFAMRVFLNADSEDRSGRATKKTALTFLAAKLFFEVLAVFGDMDESILDKIRYAKWKAADISKALREGRTPTPGPAGGIETDSPPDSDPTLTTTTTTTPSTTTTTTTTQPQIMAPISSTQLQQGAFLDPKLIESVSKHCRFATSALQYDDINTAIDNLERALALIRPLKK